MTSWLGRIFGRATPAPPETELPPELIEPMWMPVPPRDPGAWEMTGDRFGFRRATGEALGARLNDEAYALLRLDLAEARRLARAPDALLDLLNITARRALEEGDEATAIRLIAEVKIFVQRDFDKELAQAEVNHGELMLKEGRRRHAATYFMNALKLRRDSLGEDHPHTRGLADYLDAFELDPPEDEHAVEQREELRRLLGLAEGGFGTGMLDMAEVALREALAIAHFARGSSHRETAAIMLRLADALEGQGYVRCARKYLFHHADMAGLAHGEDSPEADAALARIATNQTLITQHPGAPTTPHARIEVMRADEHLYAWLMPRLAR